MLPAQPIEHVARQLGPAGVQVSESSGQRNFEVFRLKSLSERMSFARSSMGSSP